MLKDEIWSKLAKKADSTADGLGKGLDQDIRDVVISLWLAGFETTASCEGHLNWGLKAPWVDIGKNASERDLAPLKGQSMAIFKIFEDYPNLKELRDQNLKVQSELLDLLTQFYQGRNVAEDERLIITQFGIYGAMRLIIQGVEVQEINIGPDQKQKLKKYQEEMKDFSLFLKSKFLPHSN